MSKRVEEELRRDLVHMRELRDEKSERIEHIKRLLEAEVMRHTPRADEWDLQPHNTGTIRLWCNGCMSAWPCQMGNYFRYLWREAAEYDNHDRAGLPIGIRIERAPIDPTSVPNYPISPQ